MKLASLNTGGRDGTLIVTNRELTRYIAVPQIAATLQQALEHWPVCLPQLQEIDSQLHDGAIEGCPLDCYHLSAPLPRAYQWLDGSAYLSHVERVRKARGAQMPPSFLEDPLMYQGGSDTFIGARGAIHAVDETWGIDFESEVAIVTDDVPLGTSSRDAAAHIKLLMLVNDVSLRNLIPSELAKGFGFIHGKPPTAFSPVAVTPDELGHHWRDSKLHLPLITNLNGKQFGNPDAGKDMQFSFAQLIQHAAKTRPLGSGTIIGSGTVSNNDLTRGCSCLAERRVLEIIDNGQATTPFMKHGDIVKIDMFDHNNHSIFGCIEQVVET
ncbi:MAG: fumarylacetoacetate hydrolase family protein [Thiotrichaceae bacterium]|nr:fumarylacetoacetate hydrolase family protein [Thiotrichaceae bacterium]PCI14118.1 MAG: 2-keto-4-pentenoate hydratase [Thiotrichales bacterium]